MDIFLSEKAEKELDKMDEILRKLFISHIEKLQVTPPRKHLRFGIPFNVEKVTKSARLVYYIRDNQFIILHCFTTHKEYEKWYKSYK